MEQLLKILNQLPQMEKFYETIDKNQVVGVSGAAQINRSHLIASVCHTTKRPAVIICQDEMAARRTQAELAAFFGQRVSDFAVS